ncbi:ATP-grasp domain-containing protein [Candidatus Nanosalina sp. VS9-1]|uniref:ATP-grasp domain-containing protein n=1 Tax=Candidatus Nanosalina sp. VS9-1 TaxID=3388566 RepID=UPI0039DFA4A2
MELLILANDFDTQEKRFSNYFEEVEKKSLADVLIDTDKDENVLVDGERIEAWDAVYIDPEPKAFNYLRVLVEALGQKDISCNLDPSSIFILAKKPYLFSVMAERGVSIPDQVAISTEKGLTELEKDVDFPVVAKKYSSFELAEAKIFEDFDNLKSFAEISEHGKDFIMIQEYSDEDIFDVLYIDGNLISLKLEESPWVASESTSVAKKYHSISTDQKETVEDAVSSLGTSICQIRMKGNKVMDIDSSPDLEAFKEKSGKNIYGRISDMLKEGNEDE